MHTKACDSGNLLAGYNFLAPYLDGVYLATNAIEDSCLVYEAHDCGYYKAEKIAGNHDLFSSLLRWGDANRIARTNVESREFIMGGDDRLSMKLLQVAERLQPKVIFFARSNVMIFTGHDSAQVTTDLEKKIGIPIVRIPEKNADRDHLTGYLDAVAGLLSLVQTNEHDRTAKRVMLAGYVYDRHEGDHQGNILEFNRLLRGIGADPGPIFLDGKPFAEIRRFDRPDLVVDLATNWSGARDFSELVGARYLQTPLPLGIEGTASWLRRAASALDLDANAERFITNEIEQLAKRLQWVVPRFCVGRSAVVVSDRLWISPLIAFLQEIGFKISAAGCTSVPCQAASTQPDLFQTFRQVPRHAPDMLDFFADLRNKQEVDLVIGNSLINQILRPLGIPFIEMGYPSNFHHVLYPMPSLGFRGVEVLAQRIINTQLHTKVPY